MSRHNEPEDISARPNTVPWPPILLLGAVIVGGLLGRLFPTFLDQMMIGHFPLSRIQVWIGWLMVGLAVAMDFWILTIFKKHKTNIRPDRPAENLVSVGPFAYSRNPIYVGNVAIILGLALVNGSVWYLLLVPIVSWLIQELAIKREEAHMARRFGDAWKTYSGAVRRWL